MQTTDPASDLPSIAEAAVPAAPAPSPTRRLEASAGWLGRSLLVAVGALVAINVGAFLVFYRDTLGSVSIPYAEDFSRLTRLDYRQFGGTWKVEDAALVQSDASLPDLFAVLTPRLPDGAAGSIATTLRFTSPNDGGGILFGMEQPDDRAGSHLVRFGRGDDGVPYLVWGLFDRDLAFTAQGGLPLPELGDTARLRVTFGPDAYDVFVDDERVAADVPRQFRGGHLALTTWFSSVVFDDVSVDAGAAGDSGPEIATADASPTPATSAPATSAPATPAPATPAPTPEPATPAPVVTAPPVETPAPLVAVDVTGMSLGHVDAFIDAFEDGARQDDWIVQVGDWSRKDGALVQADTTRYDLAIAHRATVSEAVIKVHLTQETGLGAGILFGLPQLDSLRGGHLVRFSKDGTLFWGGFDADRVFTGEGYAPTNVQPGETHLLEVRLSGDTYAIRLDGALVVDGVPLRTAEGHIGLTTSLVRARFEDVTVAPLTPTAATSTTGSR